tara:strand:+ start:1105 stop:1530 length:426 start_codon:yes stop_codon:yes gene_type:complete
MNTVLFLAAIVVAVVGELYFPKYWYVSIPVTALILYKIVHSVGCRCVQAVGDKMPDRLRPSQQVFRIILGCILLFISMKTISLNLVISAVLIAWFGLSFIVAGATAYPGCPELGAIPSMFTSKPIDTGRSPLHTIEGKMGL